MFRKILFPFLVGASIVTGVCKNTDINRYATTVPIAEIGYVNEDKIESRGFAGCTALILDYKDKATMAHAIGDSEDRINIYNVVEKSSEELKLHGIDPLESKAIIYSSNKKDIAGIVSDLENKGIEIKKVLYDPRNITTNLSYDPRLDTLLLERYNNTGRYDKEIVELSQ